MYTQCTLYALMEELAEDIAVLSDCIQSALKLVSKICCKALKMKC